MDALLIHLKSHLWFSIYMYWSLLVLQCYELLSAIWEFSRFGIIANQVIISFYSTIQFLSIRVESINLHESDVFLVLQIAAAKMNCKEKLYHFGKFQFVTNNQLISFSFVCGVPQKLVAATKLINTSIKWDSKYII